MPLLKITFQLRAQDTLTAIAKLKREPDVFKYIVSVSQVKDVKKKNGWKEGFKSQLFGYKK